MGGGAFRRYCFRNRREDESRSGSKATIMNPESSDAAYADLPRTLAIFPLSGVLLLPGGDLPLNIFEPRYLNMIRDARDGAGVIGMIQPQEPERQDPGDHPKIFGTGCVGRIGEIEETEDGRMVLSLAGICRFDVEHELVPENGYRRVLARYDRYLADLSGADPGAIDRDRLMVALRRYFELQGIDADWHAIEKAGDDRLITTLAMICPFAPVEKQALLESASLGARGEVITTLMEMASTGDADGDGEHRVN